MRLATNKSKKTRVSHSDSEDLSDMENEKLMLEREDEEEDIDDYGDGEEEDEEEEEEEEELYKGEETEEERTNDDEEGSEEDTNDEDDNHKGTEMEELEKEYRDLHHEEQDIWKNLKRHKDEDLLKGQAVRNQKALWDKTLEIRFLLQKAFSNSNRLPQDPVRSSFCSVDERVSVAYSDLITASQKTLDSLFQLLEALIEKNPSIDQSLDGNSEQSSKERLESSKSDMGGDEEWLQIFQMQKRVAPFRNKSVDKWQRKAQVTTGAAAIKDKFHAFNQNISEQVTAYLRDPSRMIKQMQQRRSTVGVFGAVIPEGASVAEGEEAQPDGDPELLDDTEFYQQLLKEFFETIDPTSSETAFYALKRLQTKKRKIVDRRASKSRKIRYNVHEKIVNFMAPQLMELPTMAPKLFENLFGLKA